MYFISWKNSTDLNGCINIFDCCVGGWRVIGRTVEVMTISSMYTPNWRKQPDGRAT